MMDPWEEMRHAARPPRLWGVSADRWRPHRSSRPAGLPAPPPRPPLVACGRDEGGTGVRPRAEAEAEVDRRRREGGGGRAEREEAAAATAAAGGNAVADAERFAGFAAGMVARDDRGSGGGGEFGSKRGLAPDALPPRKRRAARLPEREDRGSGGDGEFRRKRGLAPAARSPPKRRAAEMRHAARPPRLWGVSADRWRPHRSSRPAGLPAPPPRPPLVACGRDEGETGVRPRAEAEAEVDRRRREGGGGRAEREETAAATAAAGGNAVADAERFAGFAAGIVARDDRGSGGGGEFGSKRGLAPDALPPPKREDRGSGGDGEFRRKRGLAPAARSPPKRRAARLPEREDRGSGGDGEFRRKRGLAPAARSPPKRRAARLPAREDRGSGGDGGFRRKRRLAPAARPPPKRKAASATRRFPAVCGRDAAAPIVRGGGKDGLLVRAAPSRGGFSTLEKAARAPPSGSGGDEQGGLLLEAAAANAGFGVLGKVVVADLKICGANAGSFATSKKSKTAESKHLPVNAASTSALGSKENRSFKFLFVSKEKLKDKVASHLEDDDVLKALAVHDGKLELCLNDPSRVPSTWCHRQDGGQNGDARSKVRMMCRRFQFLCRFLVQAAEQRSLEVPRVDLAADRVIKHLPGFTKHRPIVGKVPGIEVGDVFLFRVELAIVGLHSPLRGGIGTTRDVNGVLIAISIVASGGYRDEWSSSSELIYTGSGGKAAGNEQDGDQKLQRGNLALKNCMKTKTPVRVIHGFKRQKREEESHSKGKEISKFTYDGLYLVVDCWREGHPGSKVFKYRLQRIPGQPELPLHVAKRLRKSAVRPDVSQQKARIPISVISNADNVCPDSRRPGER